MEKSPVESLYQVLNDTANILQKELDCTYIEAIAYTGENLFQESVLQEELNEVAMKRLEKMYSEINMEQFSKEDIRKAIQLTFLKGMKDYVQANHQMTPDAIGMLVAYLINKFVEEKEIRLYDPAVGTGNFLTTVLNLLENKTVDAIGSEIDDLLIKLSYINANLQEHNVQLYNQDSLEPLFAPVVDVVIADLPVGYYPNDTRAASFKVKASDEHTYAHHLFIEQSMNQVKENGYGFFLIPNNLFDSKQSGNLHSFIKEETIIQGIIQLPLTMFKSETSAKSILILQKNGPKAKAPKKVLLVQMPSLTKTQEVESILSKINQWFIENKK